MQWDRGRCEASSLQVMWLSSREGHLPGWGTALLNILIRVGQSLRLGKCGEQSVKLAQSRILLGSQVPSELGTEISRMILGAKQD